MLNILGLFRKPTTLTFCIFFFEDAGHKAPTNIYHQNDLAAQHAVPLIQRHYSEQLKPPRKWNYYFVFLPLPDLQNPQTRHMDFRNSVTHEISDHAKYAEICSSLKTIWKERLMQVFPDYDRNKLEDGLEQANFDYFPGKNTLIVSSLMPGLVKQGTETFKDTSIGLTE